MHKTDRVYQQQKSKHGSLVWLTVVSLFLSCMAMGQANGTILILNIGQSNVVGRATANAMYEVPTTQGTSWFKKTTNSLEPLVDGVGEDISKATERSMNPMLGKRLKELTGSNVIIVPAGVGNTSIFAWEKSSNALYQRAKTMWEAALAYCATNNINVTHKYIHWLQGENDAGALETDGYYVELNNLVNDFMLDFGVEKVFATRIGYDPNYTSAEGSEKIMKAQKILGYNNPNFIMASFAPATFTPQNGKMAGDATHYSLLGENEVGGDLANTIYLYGNTGNKPNLIEPVAALQSTNTGYINLNPNWIFNFSGNLVEDNGNVTVKAAIPLAFNSEGVVFDSSHLLELSRPFNQSTFTLEMRLKMNTQSVSGEIITQGENDNYNKIYIETHAADSYLVFGTQSQYFYVNLGAYNWTDYHVLKMVQGNGVLKVYMDGVQKGGDFASASSISFKYMGKIRATLDYVRTKNTADNISPLPLKFKSFKAINIK